LIGSSSARLSLPDCHDAIIVAAGWTVLLSVVAHGVTANPLVKRIAVRSAELAA
jgi:NhaP-type Na+/H+ or K+/H+ antiporter